MIEIKKCGAHMVYEEEMEDLKESMGQSECSSSIIPYNEGVAHFEEDINSKGSRDDENGFHLDQFRGSDGSRGTSGHYSYDQFYNTAALVRFLY